jgi:hypothetical protein
MCCSGMSCLRWWYDWMYSYPYGSNSVVISVYFSRVRLLLIGPYLCLFFKTCNTYANWGSLCFMCLVCSWYLCFKLGLVCLIYDMYYMQVHIFCSYPALVYCSPFLALWVAVGCWCSWRVDQNFTWPRTATILLKNKNLANNKFTKEETELLNYSLQHSTESNNNIFHQTHNINWKSYKTPRCKITELIPFYGCQ